MSSTTTSVVLTTASLAVAFLSYAIYFDYRRRSSASFRHSLKQQSRSLSALDAELKAKLKVAQHSQLSTAIQSLQNEVYPTTPEEMEQYFLQRLSEGERWFKMGTEGYVQSSLEFYKALKVYPNPVELVTLFQKTIPEEVFEMVMGIMGEELGKSRVEEVE